MKAKKAGMSHEQVKKEQSEEAHRLKKLANKDMSFGKKEGLKTKDQIMAQRLKDMNDPTTELGKATARAAGAGLAPARVAVPLPSCVAYKAGRERDAQHNTSSSCVQVDH